MGGARSSHEVEEIQVRNVDEPQDEGIGDSAVDVAMRHGGVLVAVVNVGRAGDVGVVLEDVRGQLVIVVVGVTRLISVVVVDPALANVGIVQGGVSVCLLVGNANMVDHRSRSGSVTLDDNDLDRIGRVGVRLPDRVEGDVRAGRNDVREGRNVTGGNGREDLAAVIAARSVGAARNDLRHRSARETCRLVGRDAVEGLLGGPPLERVAGPRIGALSPTGNRAGGEDYRLVGENLDDSGLAKVGIRTALEGDDVAVGLVNQDEHGRAVAGNGPTGHRGVSAIAGCRIGISGNGAPVVVAVALGRVGVRPCLLVGDALMNDAVGGVAGALGEVRGDHEALRVADEVAVLVDRHEHAVAGDDVALDVIRGRVVGPPDRV